MNDTTTALPVEASGYDITRFNALRRAADKRCLAWQRIGAPEGWKPVDKAPRRLPRVRADRHYGAAGHPAAVPR